MSPGNANSHKFQSTHLHEVWQRGNTSVLILLLFQSTHLHEVWQCGQLCLVEVVSFNPHTYMRCDYTSANNVVSNLSFNPHTYMRCDLGFTVRLVDTGVFQSTHLHEVWRRNRPSRNRPSRFQSTHLHEVWHRAGSNRADTGSFNPHTYMRCDRNSNRYRFHIDVSIHTPTWGVTPPFALLSVWMSVSIHTPTWGVTNNINAPIEATKVSIHTPTWGVTK